MELNRSDYESMPPKLWFRMHLCIKMKLPQTGVRVDRN